METVRVGMKVTVRPRFPTQEGRTGTLAAASTEARVQTSTSSWASGLDLRCLVRGLLITCSYLNNMK